MGVGETPSGSRQSFFVHNFNRADWLTIVFGVVGFAGLMWLLFEAILSAQLAEVKTEIALVRDAVEDAEASLTSAFSTHKSEIQAIVQSGLEQRSDEIAKALLAGLNADTAYKVMLANVPTDTAAYEQLRILAATVSTGTTVTELGDKAIFEFGFKDVGEDTVKKLQSIFEMQSTTGIETQNLDLWRWVRARSD